MKLYLKDYKDLIQFLPVREQSFEVKASVWENQISKEDYTSCFEGLLNITISRQDVFDTEDIRSLILKTILWGYPNGHRGNNFEKIYNCEDLRGLVEIIKGVRNCSLNKEEWGEVLSRFKKIKGLGISTYSKLLYFSNVSIDKAPAIILDERIIKVLGKGVFEELEGLKNITRVNADRHYPTYLKTIQNITLELKTHPENIEQFLFLFGNNLKN
ncbi:hypothetical protein MODO_0791 [Myroides odoratimimus]|uniref:8-oxoguanine DNA glycosylase OGG fold protein n=1 Tax=Myroides odoratimimus TaxID=76832 RepID=UPI0007277E16|nr:hypothetical protein [Myroides odoratimimus]GAQ13144.1 hypothetical protein MODO_0791 [Myroides odoratimimus]STZ48394.1 Uncharacterised protein [Myroides odoratimimus]